MEDEVGDLSGSSDGVLRLWDIGFLGGFGRIADGADVWVQRDGGGHQVCKRRIQAGAKVNEVTEVVDEAERDAVGDQVALQVLFGALLGVIAGQVRDRAVRS